MILVKLRNKKKITLFMMGSIILVLAYFIFGSITRQNILKDMTDGMEDASIVEFYHQDIEDVETLIQGDIEIYQYTIDLNDDRQEDKIVGIQSPLHSGSHGDAVHVLINENGKYRKALYNTYRLFQQDSSNTVLGAIYILDSKHEGFRDIQVVTDGNQIMLHYDDGRYQQVSIVKGETD